MKKMIAWGFNKTGKAITLNLSATIFASCSSIVHYCRQTFGIGPMALLKQIRLAQVKHAWVLQRCSAPSTAMPCRRLPPNIAFKAAITLRGITAAN